MPRRLASAAAALAASVVGLVGCSASDALTQSDGVIRIVASTSVYGQIAESVGGDTVAVVSIIDSPTQDPHSYEASARDQLAVSRADLIIENGGGYDAFIDGLIEATGTTAPVLTAVEFSHDWPGGSAHDDSEGDDAGHDHDHDHIEGFNEHVWYDLQAMSDLARGIASKLGALDPDGAQRYDADAAAFAQSVATLQSDVARLADEHGGTHIFVTEPVPLALTQAAELTDVTPAAFSQAVEEGQDVPPATLLQALDIIRAGGAAVVIVNSQTGGVETDAVIAAATEAATPVLEFSELPPRDLGYVEWMEQNIIALGKGLHR